jgi:N utilization substance protein B
MTHPRHRARVAALRSLYFWEIGRAAPGEAVDTYFDCHEPDAPARVREVTLTMVIGVAAERERLDGLIGEHATHWRVERIAVVDRLILRLGAWELQHEAATPAAVVIDEAVELARAFGSDESPRFVNGVLDSIRKDLAAHVQ